MRFVRYDRNQSRAVPQMETLVRVKSFEQNIVVDSVKSSRQVKQQEYNAVTIINFTQNVIVNVSEGGFAAITGRKNGFTRVAKL